MENKGLKLRIYLIYLIVYGCFACYYPFLTIYFGTRKLSYTEIGIAFAMNSLIGVIFQPIWGYITDKYLYKKKTLMILMVGSSISILNFIIAKDFIFVLFSIGLYLTFQSAIGSVADAYAYEIIEHNKDIQYGRVRLMGSLGYAVAAVIVGVIIKYSNINSTFYIYTFLMLICLFVTKSIGFKGQGKGSRLNLDELLSLLKNKRFTIFIISVLIFNMALGANGSYIAILIQKTGGDVSKIGLLWFVVAISELPVLFYGSKFVKKYGAINLYMFSAVIYSMRFLIDSYCNDYRMVLIVQVMQSISFTFYVIATLQYVNEAVPANMRTSGITLYSAIGCGIGSFLGNMGGGMLLEVISIFNLYKILFLTCLIALAIAFLLRNKHQKKIGC